MCATKVIHSSDKLAWEEVMDDQYMCEDMKRTGVCSHSSYPCLTESCDARMRDTVFQDGWRGGHRRWRRGGGFHGHQKNFMDKRMNFQEEDFEQTNFHGGKHSNYSFRNGNQYHQNFTPHFSRGRNGWDRGHGRGNYRDGNLNYKSKRGHHYSGSSMTKNHYTCGKFDPPCDLDYGRSSDQMSQSAIRSLSPDPKLGRLGKENSHLSSGSRKIQYRDRNSYKDEHSENVERQRKNERSYDRNFDRCLERNRRDSYECEKKRKANKYDRNRDEVHSSKKSSSEREKEIIKDKKMKEQKRKKKTLSDRFSDISKDTKNEFSDSPTSRPKSCARNFDGNAELKNYSQEAKSQSESAVSDHTNNTKSSSNLDSKISGRASISNADSSIDAENTEPSLESLVIDTHDSSGIPSDMSFDVVDEAEISIEKDKDHQLDNERKLCEVHSSEIIERSSESSYINTDFPKEDSSIQAVSTTQNLQMLVVHIDTCNVKKRHSSGPVTSNKNSMQSSRKRHSSGYEKLHDSNDVCFVTNISDLDESLSSSLNIPNISTSTLSEFDLGTDGLSVVGNDLTSGSDESEVCCSNILSTENTNTESEKVSNVNFLNESISEKKSLSEENIKIISMEFSRSVKQSVTEDKENEENIRTSVNDDSNINNINKSPISRKKSGDRIATKGKTENNKVVLKGSVEDKKEKHALKRTHSIQSEEGAAISKRARHKTSDGTDFNLSGKKHQNKTKAPTIVEFSDNTGEKSQTVMQARELEPADPSGFESSESNNTTKTNEMDDSLPRLCSPSATRAKRLAKKNSEQKSVDDNADSKSKPLHSTTDAIKESSGDKTKTEKIKSTKNHHRPLIPVDLFKPDIVIPSGYQEKEKECDSMKHSTCAYRKDREKSLKKDCDLVKRNIQKKESKESCIAQKKEDIAEEKRSICLKDKNKSISKKTNVDKSLKSASDRVKNKIKTSKTTKEVIISKSKGNLEIVEKSSASKILDICNKTKGNDFSKKKSCSHKKQASFKKRRTREDEKTKQRSKCKHKTKSQIKTVNDSDKHKYSKSKSSHILHQKTSPREDAEDRNNEENAKDKNENAKDSDEYIKDSNENAKSQSKNSKDKIENTKENSNGNKDKSENLKDRNIFEICDFVDDNPKKSVLPTVIIESSTAMQRYQSKEGLTPLPSSSQLGTQSEITNTIASQLTSNMGGTISIFGENGVSVFKGKQIQSEERIETASEKDLEGRSKIDETDCIGEISSDLSEIDSDADDPLNDVRKNGKNSYLRPGYQDYDSISSCDEENRLVIDTSVSSSNLSLNNSGNLDSTLEKTVIFDADKTLTGNEIDSNNSNDKTIPYGKDESICLNDSSDKTLPYGSDKVPVLDGNESSTSDQVPENVEEDDLNTSNENLEEEINSGDYKEFTFQCGIPQSPWTPAPPTPAPQTPYTHIESDMETTDNEAVNKVINESEIPLHNSKGGNDQNEKSSSQTPSNAEPKSDPMSEILGMVNLRPSVNSKKVASSVSCTKEVTLSQKMAAFNKILTSMKSEIPDGIESSHSTESSSDYGTDSDRGTPFSDVSDASSVVIVKKEISDTDDSNDEPIPKKPRIEKPASHQSPSPSKVGRSKSTDSSIPQVPTCKILKRHLSTVEGKKLKNSEIAMMRFLSDLRKKNFSSCTPIAFSHIKTLESGKTMNTIGHMDPRKFKEQQLNIIQCQGCQYWFTCLKFFMHIDGNETVSKVSLEAEPRPTKKLSPEDQSVWEKFLHIKDYHVKKELPRTADRKENLNHGKPQTTENENPILASTTEREQVEVNRSVLNNNKSYPTTVSQATKSHIRVNAGQGITTSSSDVQQFTTSSSDVQQFTTSSSDVQHFTTSSSDVQQFTTSSSDVQQFTTSSSDVQHFTTSSSDVQQFTTSSSDVQKYLSMPVLVGTVDEITLPSLDSQVIAPIKDKTNDLEKANDIQKINTQKKSPVIQSVSTSGLAAPRIQSQTLTSSSVSQSSVQKSISPHLMPSKEMHLTKYSYVSMQSASVTRLNPTKETMQSTSLSLPSRRSTSQDSYLHQMYPQIPFHQPRLSTDSVGCLDQFSSPPPPYGLTTNASYSSHASPLCATDQSPPVWPQVYSRPQTLQPFEQTLTPVPSTQYALNLRNMSGPQYRQQTQQNHTPVRYHFGMQLNRGQSLPYNDLPIADTHLSFQGGKFLPPVPQGCAKILTNYAGEQIKQRNDKLRTERQKQEITKQKEKNNEEQKQKQMMLNQKQEAEKQSKLQVVEEDNLQQKKLREDLKRQLINRRASTELMSPISNVLVEKRSQSEISSTVSKHNAIDQGEGMQRTEQEGLVSLGNVTSDICSHEASDIQQSSENSGTCSDISVINTTHHSSIDQSYQNSVPKCGLSNTQTPHQDSSLPQSKSCDSAVHRLKSCNTQIHHQDSSSLKSMSCDSSVLKSKTCDTQTHSQDSSLSEITVDEGLPVSNVEQNISRREPTEHKTSSREHTEHSSTGPINAVTNKNPGTSSADTDEDHELNSIYSKIQSDEECLQLLAMSHKLHTAVWKFATENHNKTKAEVQTLKNEVEKYKLEIEHLKKELKEKDEKIASLNAYKESIKNLTIEKDK